MTDLAKLKELEQAATPGPWTVESIETYGAPVVLLAHGALVLRSDGSPGFEDDVQFVLAIRNSAPALISEIERLRAEFAAAMRVVEAARELFETDESDCRIISAAEEFSDTLAQFDAEQKKWQP